MINDRVMMQEAVRKLGVEDEAIRKHTQGIRPRTWLEHQPLSRRLLGGRVVSELIEVGTWTQPAALVAVCATLLLLYLRFRPAKTGEVRLRGAAGPKVRTGRA